MTMLDEKMQFNEKKNDLFWRRNVATIKCVNFFKFWFKLPFWAAIWSGVDPWMSFAFKLAPFRINSSANLYLSWEENRRKKVLSQDLIVTLFVNYPKWQHCEEVWIHWLLSLYPLHLRWAPRPLYFFLKKSKLSRWQTIKCVKKFYHEKYLDSCHILIKYPNF